MTKIECLNRAEAARQAAKLAQDALVAHDAAIDAHYKWMDVAYLHPSTRARLIRDQSLPASIFGY